MYTLFESPNPKQAPRWHFQGFESVRRRWQENITRLTGYWATSGIAVDSQHILSRLIGSFSIPLYSDVRKYRDRISDLVPQLCMANGIVAPTNGRIPQNDKGWFYGLTGREYIISVDFGYSPESIAKKWREIETFRVVRHPFTDVDMRLPQGGTDNGGYAVFEIDIPALAVQYWCWSQEQLKRPEGERQRLQQFIGQFVLPQLLYSQTTVGWFNRILATFNGESVAKEGKSGALALGTNYTGMDRVIDQLLVLVRANQLTYTELLATIPTARNQSMLAFAQLPDTVVHRQNQWAIELGYIPYTSLAVQATLIHGGSQNQAERNALQRLVKRITTDRLFDAAPRNVREDIVLDFLVRVGNFAV